MSIVQLDKITIYGAAPQKEAAIERLQELGCIHLENLSGSEPTSSPGAAVAQRIRDALKYLRATRHQRRPAKREDHFDPTKVESEALAIQRRTGDLEDERDELRKAIEELEPWGSFHLPPADALGGLRLWFYYLHPSELAQMADVDLVWQEVGRDHEYAYVVILSETEPVDVPATRAELEERPLEQLEARLEEVEEEIEELQYRRVGLTRWGPLMAENLARADDQTARHVAAEQAIDRGELFAIQGWAPRAARQDLLDLAAAENLAITAEPPGEDDEPPTLLHNAERFAGGEGAVTFYMTPGYHTWDPSITVFFSFAFFFGMILGDAGYGAVLGLVLWWQWGKLGATQGGRRFRNLALALVIAAITYGVMAGGYFGVTPPEDSFLGALKVLDVNNLGIMMTLSIAIGVAHLTWANLVTAWRLRHSAEALSPLGWAAVMLGGLVAGMAVFGPEHAGTETMRQMGIWMVVGGFGAVFLFSSKRPLLSTNPWDYVGRVVDGLMALTRVSSAFSDVLSYLRLFALGLASAKLAETFNGLAQQAATDAHGIAVLVAVLILLFGHSLNLLLAIMSGVVHGLRLNCIELFNWSLPEEGYLFRAFSKRARS